MKKLLSLLICFSLVISIALVGGCSPSIFNGNYQEVQAATVEQMATQISQAEKGQEMDYAQGTKVFYDMKITGAEDMRIKIDLKSIAVENDLQMQASMQMTANNQTHSSDIYLTQGYMYASTINQGQSMKIKTPMTIDEMLGGFAEDAGAEFFYSICAILDMLEDREGVKWYIEDKEDLKKIKVDYAQENMGEIKVCLVYNAQFKLIAMLYELRLYISLGTDTMGVQLKMSVEPWIGTISLPTDLDTYIEDPF